MQLCMSTIGACRQPWLAALDAVVAAGFNAVEILMIPGWIHLDPRTDRPAAARGELDRRGLRPVGVHGGGIDGGDEQTLARSLDYVGGVIAFAGALGCEFVNVNGMPVAEGTAPAERDGMLERIIAGVRALLPVARRHGVRLAIENHHGFQVETIDDYLRIFAALPGSDDLGATIDTWHFAASGISPAAVARALGRRIAHVHVKDIAKPALGAEHRALIRELALGGYGGWLSAEVELHDAGEEAEAVARSHAYLRWLAASATTTGASA